MIRGVAAEVLATASPTARGPRVENLDQPLLDDASNSLPSGHVAAVACFVVAGDTGVAVAQPSDVMSSALVAAGLALPTGALPSSITGAGGRAPLAPGNGDPAVRRWLDQRLMGTQSPRGPSIATELAP